MWLKQLGEMLQATPKAPGTKGNLAGKDSSGGRITRPPEKSYSDAGGNRHQQRHIRTRSETRQPAGLSPNCKLTQAIPRGAEETVFDMPPVVSARHRQHHRHRRRTANNGRTGFEGIPKHPTNGSWGRKASIKQFLINMFIVNRLATWRDSFSYDT
jgi:hypothetical protein